MGDIYTNPPQSRNEAILRATIDGTEYTAPPQSRIEDLLLELKQAIEEGGGTGEGDMKKAVYDADRAVQNAGGIAAYVGDEITDLELGTASKKNSTSVVTDSTDLVESGAVFDVVGWGNKNLFYSPYDTITSGGYTAVKNSDGTFTINGLDTVQSRALKLGTFTFKANTTYMLSGCPANVSNQIYLRAADNNYTIQKIDNGDGVEVLFDTDTTLNIEIRCGVNQTMTNAVFSPMIELGDTKTAYEPYHASVEDYCASKEDVKDIVGWGNKNIGVWNNVALSGDATVGYKLNANGSSLIAPIKNNTNYTVSRKSTSYGNRFRIILFKNEPSSTPSLEALVIVNNDATLTEYTFNSGAYNYVVFTYESTDVITQDTAEAMIELGSVKTAYEPYHESVEDAKCDNSVIAPVESGATSSKAYAVGEHFIRDGAFCTVTTAITSGESLVGSNKFTSGDVASALKGFYFSTIITNLSNVPLGFGVINLDGTISPIGSILTVRYIRFGDSNNSVLIACRVLTGILYVNFQSDGTWSGWKTIDLSLIS